MITVRYLVLYYANYVIIIHRVPRRSRAMAPTSEIPPRWADETFIEYGREPMHPQLRAHESIEQALARGCTGAPVASKWVLPLTPAEWHFQLMPSPAEADVTCGKQGFDTAGWGTIHVPMSWQMAETTADQPLYTNYRYPFGGKAESLKQLPVPRGEGNSVGTYQTEFALPDAWNGRRVLLQLDGVDSNATVWMDGVEVGYSQDSRLPAEFDVTEACARATRGARVSGEHTLSVRCHRFCDGSYLEDQVKALGACREDVGLRLCAHATANARAPACVAGHVVAVGDSSARAPV